MKRSPAPAAASCPPSRATRAASEDDLLAQALPRARPDDRRGRRDGRGQVRLWPDIETELRMLRVARRIGAARPVTVRTTFLGAHAVPPEYKGRADAYLAEQVASPPCAPPMPRGWSMRSMPSAKASPFRPRRCDRLFAEARRLGLPVKLHAEQLSNLGRRGARRPAWRAVGRSSGISRRADGIARDGRRRHRRGDPARGLLHPARNASAARSPPCAQQVCRWRWPPTATPAPRP